MPHLLIIGESGVGKSLAARELAQRAKVQFLALYGPVRPDAVASKLLQAKHGDYLFLDEAHRLPHDSQELLYPVMDAAARNAAAELPPVRGFTPPSPPQAAAASVPAAEGPSLVPPLTLVLATNQPGLLLAALRKRVHHHILFGTYAQNELTEIVGRTAGRLGVLLSVQAAGLVARMAHGLPRCVEQHVRNLRLHYPEAETRELSKCHVRAYLRAFGFDAHGLGNRHRQYLRHLRALGGRASLETLAGFLGTDRDYLSGEIEPPLLRQLLIVKGPHGRQLTSKGRELLNACHQRNRRRKGNQK
jgi:Holliday junction DNA helicase RuvB